MGYKVHVDQVKCIGCAQCYAVCPNKVFVIDDKKSIPANTDKCVGCRACIVRCPTAAIVIIPRDVEALYARFYAT
ncbi:MAG: ferredoxin family protein [Sulfolobales archaeon]|nr:ferredoxin family protein [Ignisphaera sp.]MCX8199739.1 ferredoxin family protein [Sulfolobales archaeon]MDW8085024.1 ferredoxin family protein [Ignisphaera sp.]